MLKRNHYLKAIRSALADYPICALIGPRQCGKTTLAREIARRRRSHFFDLETAVGRTRLANPELAFTGLSGLIVIDEVQRLPELFTTLRPLADRSPSPARFLILGSASPDHVRGASESLAGRVGFVELGPFDIGETGANKQNMLWNRGGFPRAFLAKSDSSSLDWRQNFIRTFLERDIPQLGFRMPTEALRRFWMMLAHYHAQLWSGAELARSLGVSEHTVRGYLDVLTGTFLVRQLPPWFENLGKRQYKSPKVYIRDSGILHALLTVGSLSNLSGHPKYGASWEGFALEQVLAIAGSQHSYYWRTHNGAELDLLLLRRGKRFGIEFKISDGPQMTKSLHHAIDDLKLERAWIIYPGKETYPVHEKVQAIPLRQLSTSIKRYLG